MTLVWHDDVRKAPDESWTWARTNIQAQHLLESGNVEEISLDHDMGGEHMDADHPRTMYYAGKSLKNGMALVEWMILHDLVPEKVTIHSWNRSGSERMAASLRASGHDPLVIPFDPTPDEPKRCLLCGKARHPQRSKFCSDACRELANEVVTG